MSLHVWNLLDALEEIYPSRYAFPDDNGGLMLGDPAASVTRVAVALDPDSGAIDAARAAKCELLVSHHPLIFRAPRVITTGSHSGRALLEASASRLNIISCHTKCDFAPDGLCDTLARRLELSDLVPLTQVHGVPTGRIGLTAKPRRSADWLKSLGKIFGGELRLSGAAAWIERVAVCTGSGADLLDATIASDCDAFVTGDIKYHAAREAEDHAARRPNGFLLVDGGHFGTERHFAPLTIGRLRKVFPSLKYFPVKARSPFRSSRMS